MRRPIPNTTPARREAAPQRDRWLLSYADFITLLLALFLVLYASARADAEKSRGLIEGLQSAFALDAGPEDTRGARRDGGRPEEPEWAPRRDRPPAGALAALERLETSLVRELEQLRTTTRKEPGIQIHPSERGLVISLAAAEFFPAGDAEIPPDRLRLLAAIAPLLAAETGALHFEGHADDQPVERNGRYPSNWELSSARAAAVARYFIEKHDFDPQRIAATGYAAYRPIDPGETPAARARNRRVEIVVLADAELEPAETTSAQTERALGRLLERLPALEAEAPEGLRPAPRGPKPLDVPLP